MAGNYTVVARNLYGKAVSATAQIAVFVPPTPVHQPASQIVKIGQNVVLTATATGDAPLTYAWQFNGSPIS